jgi:hypothetical protein
LPWFFSFRHTAAAACKQRTDRAAAIQQFVADFETQSCIALECFGVPLDAMFFFPINSRRAGFSDLDLTEAIFGEMLLNWRNVAGA